MGKFLILMLVLCVLSNRTEHTSRPWQTTDHVTPEDSITTEGVTQSVPKGGLTPETVRKYLPKEIRVKKQPRANNYFHGGNSTRESTIQTSVLNRVYKFNPNATNGFLATDATKFSCGSTGLCNQTPPWEFGQGCATCYPCSCDETCHFYGDCCPDLLFGDSVDSPSQPFPFVSCVNQHWTTWGGYSDVFMVNSCPSEADPIISRKCLEPDINDQEQATPVSVLKTQMTYRNIFCAWCHNTSDVLSWRHHVKCRTEDALNTAKSKADLWRRVLADGCKIESYPPVGVTPRQCFLSEVNTCPNGSDPVIENLCLSFKHAVMVYDEFYPNHTMYRNIFCAACNGEPPSNSKFCFIGGANTGRLPYPLNVLLDFNPNERREPASGGQIRSCGMDQVYDIFSDSCRNITCSDGKYLEDGDCKTMSDSGDSVGYLLDVSLVLTNASESISQVLPFVDQYSTMLHEELVNFHPFLWTNLSVSVYEKKIQDMESEKAEEVLIRGRLLLVTNANITKQQKALTRMISHDFSYNASGQVITLLSRPRFCGGPFELPLGHSVLSTSFQTKLSGAELVDCKNPVCMNQARYTVIPLSCPFVEYTDRFEENFTFDPLTHNLQFRNHSVFLNEEQCRICGRNLRLCIGAIANLTKIIFNDKMKTATEEPDSVLVFVSLICLSLSLASLMLTFIIYCILPKLRTLPGKISMALIFHLFCSHLLFLTTSNRTTYVVLCQVFGVLLHYFWMASFTWMFVSAYHMYTVFTRVRVNLNGNGERKRLIVYSLTGIFVPLLTIASCIVTHRLQSDGMEIGYGGTICFLNSSFAIGVFFVGPLALILLVNATFFSKTVLAIRSVPAMKFDSNKPKQKHVYVYIKLSLLFGFTWIFGILEAISHSTALQYIFTVLTGSQGVMIFAAYCVNSHTLALLKARMFGALENRLLQLGKNNSSSNVSTVSTETKL